MCGAVPALKNQCGGDTDRGHTSEVSATVSPGHVRTGRVVPAEELVPGGPPAQSALKSLETMQGERLRELGRVFRENVY